VEKRRQEHTKKGYVNDVADSSETALDYAVPHKEPASSSSSNNDSDSEETIIQNILQYPQLSEMMERTGISNRDACKIINTCLKDMKLDIPEN
jgi:hypothetical protein